MTQPLDVSPTPADPHSTLPGTGADSVGELIDLLRETGHFSAEQLQELATLRERNPEPRSLASVLIQRGWATPFQVNAACRGESRKLVLGPYVLVERIGEGGMGQVFKAYHRLLRRDVALKIIRPEHCANFDLCQRFLVEIRALGSLSHPNIIQVYDANEAEGTLYFAMEFAPGTDLGKLVKQQHPLPIANVCDWVRQAALGLQHAHEQGLVHRDVKPGNLLLVQREKQALTGTVKLLDLGLVRIQRPADGETGSELTQFGTVLGTPDYIAPEQILDAHSVDIRGDIYSLGCTLYHLLAGVPPFAGISILEKLRCHQGSEPRPLATLRPEVSFSLAAVCRKMMEKDPGQRYQTPREAAAALLPFAQKDGAEPPLPATGTYYPPVAERSAAAATQALPSASAARPRGGRKPLWLALAAVLLLGVVGLVSCAGLLIVVPLMLGTRDAVNRSNDPHRDHLARPDEEERRDREPVKPPPEKEPRKPADNSEPPVALVPGNPWAPEHHLLTLGDPRGRHWGLVYRLAYSPDGKWLATCTQLSPTQNRLYLWDAATLREQRILTDVGYVTALTFAPDSKTLAVASGGQSIQFWEIQDGKFVKGAKLSLPEETKQRHFGPIAFAPDGRGLVSWDTQGIVWRWKRRGAEWLFASVTQPLTPRPTELTVSGNGRTLAYAHTAQGTGKTQVMVKDLERPEAEPRLVDTILTPNRGLVISDDGRRLAFGTGSEIRIWNLAGEQPSKWSAIKPPQSNDPAVWRFSPDGRFLLCSGRPGWDRHPDRALWLCEVSERDAAPPVELKDPAAQWGVVSFTGDGSTLAIGGRDHAVRVWDRTGKEWRARPWYAGHAGPVSDVSFSADGKQLVAVSRTTSLLEPGELSSLRIWDVEKDAKPRVIPLNGWYQQARFLDDKQVVACGGEFTEPNRIGRQSFVACWEGTTGKELSRRTAPGHASALAVSANGKRLALGSSFPGSGTVNFFALPGLEARGTPFKTSSHESLALSPDGNTLAIPVSVRHEGIGSIQVIKFWDVRALEKEAPREVTIPEGRTLEFGKHIHVIAQLEFSADGKHLFALARTSAMKNDFAHVWVWDLKTGTETVLLEKGKRTSVTGFAQSPDGKTLATSDMEHTVTLWDVATAKKLHQWEYPGPVHSVCFDARGQRLATGNGDGTVSILRVPAR